MSRLCVKNLPKYVNEDRLREFFSQKGEVTDAKLMRTRDGKSRQFAFVGFRTEREADVAIKFFNNSYMDTFRIGCEVIFLEAAEARSAFKGLAYKRYKDAPLYLEWAPENILSPDPASERDDIKNVASEQNIKSVLLEQSMEVLHEEDIDPDRVESRSLFLKNLNFKTNDDSLREHFSGKIRKGSIRSVKVKKHLKNGKNVSMGFGFIEFDSLETATSVCQDFQGTILDGHALILQLCHVKKEDQVLKKNEKDKSSTKLIVRNVAFEATEKDLRQLFSPFGQVNTFHLVILWRRI